MEQSHVNSSDLRRGRNMQQIGICTRSSQPSDQAVLKHIGATAGILADDNASRIGVTIAFTQCIIIPAKTSTR